MDCLGVGSVGHGYLRWGGTLQTNETQLTIEELPSLVQTKKKHRGTEGRVPNCISSGVVYKSL